jgi:hypothetical protein
MGKPTNVNRKYKSSVFADYFSDREKLIEAYNAIVPGQIRDEAVRRF